MVILGSSCHEIHSSLNERCKDKLSNITTRIKEMKLKIGFSSQGKSTDKFNFTALQLAQTCCKRPKEDKKSERKKSLELRRRSFC